MITAVSRCRAAGFAALLLTAPLACTSCRTAAAHGPAATQPPVVAAATPTPNGVLKIGALLPQSGNEAELGPPELAGVNLAIADILAAGGVLGRTVDLATADSGDVNSDLAPRAVEALIGQNVDAVIGPAMSSLTLEVIDRIVNAGLVEVSPSNTITELTHYSDHGLYFRTAPSDVLQGRVIARTARADGARTLAVLAIQARYGTDLAGAARDEFTRAGGTVTTVRNYNPNVADFSPDVQAIKDTDPDAIALIGFDEAGRILNEMLTGGLLPLRSSGKHLYMVDGNTTNPIQIGPGALEGIKGTVPGSQPSQEFRDRLLTLIPTLTDFTWAAKAYDAVTLLALAAEEAHSAKGTDIAAHMRDVSTSGTKCTSFADCVQLLHAGSDIDYDGASGPIDLDTNGDISVAAMGLYIYDATNHYHPLRWVTEPVNG